MIRAKQKFVSDKAPGKRSSSPPWPYQRSLLFCAKLSHLDFLLFPLKLSFGFRFKHISSTFADSRWFQMLPTFSGSCWQGQKCRGKGTKSLGTHGKVLPLPVWHCQVLQDPSPWVAQLQACPACEVLNRDCYNLLVKILKVKSNSHFFWRCVILLLESHSLWVWKVADNTAITDLSCVGFLLPIYISQALLPLPPLESWRNTAQRVDVRIRLWQHESFIKIPVMLSSLAGALRPYFSESNFRFRHKYVLLVYHKLSVVAFCLPCVPQLPYELWQLLLPAGTQITA